jgi:hypothetical protein
MKSYRHNLEETVLQEAIETFCLSLRYHNGQTKEPLLAKPCENSYPQITQITLIVKRLVSSRVEQSFRANDASNICNLHRSNFLLF